MNKILIIEDDPSISKALVAALQAEHYKVVHHANGDKGYRNAQHERFDLILLDLMLPGMNGEEICRRLRKEGIAIPILMLTSKTDEMEKVTGLEIGADDYVTKPFSLKELQARIKVLLRRPVAIKQRIDSYAFGGVLVDFPRSEVRKNKEVVKFSKREFDILRFFIDREGQVVTRDMLLDEVWGYDTFPTTRTVDNFILAMRKKLEDDPSEPKHILTLHGAGYRFVKGE
ncbi:MAG TPA: response regulator transcription factor [Candidatus Kapabacteria bacterium]|nr:response regulator transcription factor [Candidatus Kapabacteria bacterium]